MIDVTRGTGAVETVAELWSHVSGGGTVISGRSSTDLGMGGTRRSYAWPTVLSETQSIRDC